MTELLRQLDQWMTDRPGRSATILAWTNQVLSIGANLVILPLILYRVGADANVWFFLLAWTGFFVILDFGFTQCISRQITFSMGEKGFRAGNDRGRYLRIGGTRAIASTLAAARTLFRIVSVLILLLGIGAERTFLFTGNMAAGPNAHLCWYLIIAATILNNEMRLYGTALFGMLVIPQMRLIGLLQNLIQNFCIIAFLLIWPRLELMGAAILAGSLFGAWQTLALWESRRPSGLIIGKAKATVVGSLWRASWESGVASTANYFTGAVNPIAIGYLVADKNAVAAYFLPLRIATLLFVGISDIMNPQVNFMVSLYRDHNIHGLLVKFFRIFFVVGVLSFIAYLGFALLGPWVVHLWSMGRVQPPPGVFWIMSLYWFLAILQTMIFYFIVAHGLMPVVRPAIGGAILNIVLLFILTPKLGLVGAASATFLAQLLTSNWFMPWYASRLFQEHFKTVPFRLAARDALTSLQGDLRQAVAFFRPR